MLKSRLVSLAVTALMIGSAPVLTAPTAPSAFAATTAAAVSSHSTAAASTACVHIQFGVTDVEIEGAGVNHPVVVTNAPGSCFTLRYNFTTVFGTTVYTGYEYQDLSGHCLWDNNGTIDVGAACGGLGHPNEEFFGSRYTSGCGWFVSDVTRGPSVYMWLNTPGETAVRMSGANASCWNFPS